MKQITILLSLLLMTFTLCISQSVNPKLPLTREEYMTKSKNQKETAWILLGTGTVAMCTGVILFNTSGADPFSDAAAAGGLLILAGGIMDVVSVPFFISAGSNKRKGMDALTFIKLDAVPFELRNIPGYPVMPTASVKVRF